MWVWIYQQPGTTMVLTGLKDLFWYEGGPAFVDFPHQVYSCGPHCPIFSLQDKQVNDHIVAEYVQFVRERLGLTATPQMSRHIVLFSRTRNRHILNEVGGNSPLLLRSSVLITTISQKAATTISHKPAFINFSSALNRANCERACGSGTRPRSPWSAWKP